MYTRCLGVPYSIIKMESAGDASSLALLRITVALLDLRLPV